MACSSFNLVAILCLLTIMPAYGKAATAALATRGLWSHLDEHHWISPLGTPHFDHLPHFRSDNPLPQGRPWAGRTCKNTNFYHDTPNTGVTRRYTWSVDRVPCNPDGLYENTCLLINNEFPGPAIEANWGDWVEVEVTNNIPDEGTAIHWHGLLQKETPYMDGVPGNTQCPIAPNKTFTYRFRADLYGSTWYHSHWSAQYGSGLFGPIIIYGPYDNANQYDADLGPVMIHDYFWSYYEEAVAKTLAPLDQAGPPLANNNLINGKASNGTTGMASFSVTSGKTYRMRLINPSSASVEKFSIDGYTFTVFANDFVPIEPYETDVVTLSIGQRTDILFKATGKPTDSVWMRGFRPPPCGPSAGGEEVKAAIFYEEADHSKEPTTQPGPNAYSLYCGNDPLSKTVPTYPIPAGDADYTEVIQVAFRPNGTALLWYMNDISFRIDYNDPILLEASLGNLDFDPIRSVHNYGTNKTVRFVIENPVAQPHPMHLHGHNIQVLQEGPCTAAAPPPTNATKRDLEINYGTKDKRQDAPGSCWDGTIVNPENPQRRDVHMLQANSYIVIQYFQDNPGVWPLHCHIAWHLSAGMAWMVLENPDSIETEMSIPSIMSQTCRDWAAYSKVNVVKQIDDGI